VSLTKEEWAIVEEKLKVPYRPVAMMCDGFHVILVVQSHKELTFKIYVYVNGKIRFHEKNNPEVSRFCFPGQHYRWDAKSRGELKRWSKRRLKEYGYDPEEKFTVYLPWWGSFKALKAHLVKNNQEIELLKNWKYEPEGRK
jgi:hypothetical protein